MNSDADESGESEGRPAVPAGWEAGSLVPEVPPNYGYERLVDVCLDAGVSLAVADDCATAAEEVIAAQVSRRTADAVRELLLRLEGTTAAEALRRVLLADDEPLRDAAKRLGCSHVALWKMERKIRGRLTRSA